MYILKLAAARQSLDVYIIDFPIYIYMCVCGLDYRRFYFLRKNYLLDGKKQKNQVYTF